MSEIAIEWNNAVFAVRQGFWMRSKQILHGITIHVPKGTVLGLVGPNGAGKTTTIKLGAGLLYPESGQVLIYGRPAVEPASRNRLGLLTESQYIYHHLRLREWLIMLAGFSGIRRTRCHQRVEEILELVHLKERGHQMMHTLSKGQLQRAGLAQALIHEPDILLLDEPMSGLDPYWRYRFQKILSDFKSAGGTILFSSHILADVERLSDQVALLENGAIRWTGRLADMPRQIKGYEAICRTDQPELLRTLAHNNKITFQPEGGWVFSIDTNQKEALLKLVSDQRIILESLKPIQEEIEEVLFGFASGSLSVSPNRGS